MSKEEKMTKLLDFPYDAFLMVRLEFVQILEDELEAKCLRIVEKYIDIERKRLYQQAINTGSKIESGTVIDVPQDISVAISHKVFMNDLFGTVTSENTVKRAVKNLETKGILFTQPPLKRYDGIRYAINIPLLQGLLNLLGSGYQFLIPSIFDGIKNCDHQILIPSEYQTLIPSVAFMVSKFDTHITVITDNSNGITENPITVTAEPVSPTQKSHASAESIKTPVKQVSSQHEQQDTSLLTPPCDEEPTGLSSLSPTSAVPASGKVSHPEPLPVEQDIPRFDTSAKSVKKQIPHRQDEILALYCETTGTTVPRSRKMLDGARLLAECGASDADIMLTIKAIQQDSFYARQMTLTTVADQLSSRVALSKMAVPPAQEQSHGNRQRAAPVTVDWSQYTHESFEAEFYTRREA